MDLTDFAKQLLANGFRVFHTPSHPSYLFAVIDGQIGYVQEADGGGYKYTTVHKPNTETGTGFRFTEGALSVETMRACCKCFAPEWWGRNTASVKKWDLLRWIAANPNLTEMN